MKNENENELNIIPKEIAKIFYESKIFKDVQSEAQAIVKIIAGRELGLTPIQSMNSIFIVENKVGYETKIFLSKIKKSKIYDYSVLFKKKQDKNGQEFVQEAQVSFFKKVGEKPDDQICIGTSNFSIYDAAKIGLINKKCYQNYPQLMLFYRAASNGIKMFCPDILDGATLVEDYAEIVSNDNETETEVELIENKICDRDKNINNFLEIL